MLTNISANLMSTYITFGNVTLKYPPLPLCPDTKSPFHLSEQLNSDIRQCRKKKTEMKRRKEVFMKSGDRGCARVSTRTQNEHVCACACVSAPPIVLRITERDFEKSGG